MLWSISRFTCFSLILAGKYLLCCKSSGRFTLLLIILPDDCPRLTYFWKHACLCLHVQKHLPLIPYLKYVGLCLGLFFFFFSLNFIRLLLSCDHFWEPKFSCQVGIHLDKEAVAQSQHVSLNTHLFAYVIHLYCFPEQKLKQSDLLASSPSNEGSLLLLQRHSSCQMFLRAALLDGYGSFGAPLIAL